MPTMSSYRFIVQHNISLVNEDICPFLLMYEDFHFGGNDIKGTAHVSYN
jgi:hypothetical protein